jgi:hypothetical protein
VRKKFEGALIQIDKNKIRKAARISSLPKRTSALFLEPDLMEYRPELMGYPVHKIDQIISPKFEENVGAMELEEQTNTFRNRNNQRAVNQIPKVPMIEGTKHISRRSRIISEIPRLKFQAD